MARLPSAESSADALPLPSPAKKRHLLKEIERFELAPARGAAFDIVSAKMLSEQFRMNIWKKASSTLPWLFG